MASQTNILKTYFLIHKVLHRHSHVLILSVPYSLHRDWELKYSRETLSQASIPWSGSTWSTITVEDNCNKGEHILKLPLKAYRDTAASTATGRWSTFVADRSLENFYLLSPYTLPLKMCEIRDLVNKLGKKKRHISNLRATPPLPLSSFSNKKL